MPGYEVVIWFGVLAPTGTPAPIVDKISKDLAAIMKTPEMKERLSKLGAEPAGTTPAEFADLMKADTAKWSKVVKSSGARVD